MAYTTIDDPTLYFSTTTYTGDGNQNRAVTIDGTGMQPDWLWVKNRSAAEGHVVGDSVRGATIRLIPNDNGAEATRATNIASFTSDGFTVANGGVDGAVNTDAATYVSWAWKKVAGVFDIVTYAGNNTGSRQVSHNLGVVPSLIIIKNRTNASSWWVGSTEIPFTWNTDYLQLNETAAKGTDGGGHIFGAVPTSSYFVPGDNNDTNGNSNNYVAYLFGNKQGVSKVGSYLGNGNADGTYIHLGFKPAFFMLKGVFGEPWLMYDNKRLGYNVRNDQLIANTTGAEDGSTASWYIDILSNGVKLRGNDTAINGTNSAGYIYMAFAENPFVTSGGVPATAR